MAALAQILAPLGKLLAALHAKLGDLSVRRLKSSRLAYLVCFVDQGDSLILAARIC
jgi:hypothetical protein